MKKMLLCVALCGFSLRAQDRRELVAELANLYPHLSAADLEEKIAGNNNSFQFLRSFVAYFYSVAPREILGRDAETSLHTISAEAAWCAGDAHLENFGTILDRNAVAHFRINDKDDAGPCPAYLDTLRFLVSIRLGAPSLDREAPAAALEAYRQGLQGEVFNFSEAITALISKAERKGPRPKNSLEDEKGKEQGRDLNDHESNDLKATIAHEYGADVGFIAGFAFRPTTGGSSHLQRFRVELEFPTNSSFLPSEAERRQVIEFKSVVSPGIYPAATALMPSVGERFRRSFALDESDQVAPLFRVARVGEREMLLRPRWAGHIGIDLKDFEGATALAKLARDEAYVLGTYHRGSVSTTYVNHFANVRLDDWLRASERLAQRIESSYAISKRAP